MRIRDFVCKTCLLASALALAGGSLPALAAGELPALNLDLSQTTVSGISSGAFMAVQFGVAHSATVRGVAATAGGPYFCAGRDSWAGAGVSKAIARCMQGDPSYPAVPITADDLTQMTSAARAWASRGLIDSVDNLAGQTVWLFHGYNDGIVKKPVSDALYQWYASFTPAARIFYKDELRAAHAQISASCDSSSGACQPCATTGGNFINACTDGKASTSLYDAAGAALQLFYGPLARTASPALKGKVQSFDQKPYIQKNGGSVDPIKVSMADSGYLYLPPDCAAGESCRLHIAFHGCQQQAGQIGTAFVTSAGFNEWADANRIVVLYPQTAATSASPITPFNPQGCWDWWGYNDFSFDMPGHYATKDGLQIAAVWRMVQRLAAASNGTAKAKAAGASAPVASVLDASAKQIALTWTPVAEASGYSVYRGDQRLAKGISVVSLVDSALAPSSAYTYTVRPVTAAGDEGAASAVVTANTAPPPPSCDPYFSLAKNSPVTRNNVPTNKTCP